MLDVPRSTDRPRPPAAARPRTSGALIALALAAACGGHAATQDPANASLPLRVVRTFPLPGVSGRIDHLTLDRKRDRLLIAALGNGTVEIVPLAGGERQSIKGLEEPQGIAYLADLDRFAVACGGDGSVHFYDAATLAPAGTAELGSDADNLRYDAAGKRVYVGYGHGLAALDATTGKVLWRVALHAHPESFQLESSGQRVFVNVAARGEVQVVDRERAEVTATWRVKGASANFPMALDEPAHRLYLGCRRPTRIAVLDTESGRTLALADCSDDPDDLFLDPDTGHLLISTGAGYVDVLRRTPDDHLTTTARVRTAPGARTSLLDHTTHHLYVAAPHPAHIVQLTTRRQTPGR